MDEPARDLVRASGALTFHQRIHTLLILRGIARLQRNCTVWAIAILAVLSFTSMLITAGKQNEKHKCVSAGFRPIISNNLAQTSPKGRRQRR